MTLLDKSCFLIISGMPFVYLFNSFYKFELSDISFRVADIFIAVCFLILEIQVIQRNRIDKMLLFYLTVVLSLTLITIFGLLISDKFDNDWSRDLHFYETMFLAPLAYVYLNTKSKMETFIKNVMISGLIMSFVSIYLFFTNPELHRIAGYVSYAGGEGLDKQASFNEWGSIYAIILCVIFYELIKNGTITKYKIFTFIIVSAGMVLVQSRSAIFSIIIVVSVLFYEKFKSIFTGKISKKLVKSILFTIFAFVLTIIAYKFLTINRFSDTFKPGSNAYLSMSSRFKLWDLGITLLFDQLGMTFIGHGNNYFLENTGSVSSDNFYLDHMISSGVIGITIIMYFFLYPALKLRKRGLLKPNSNPCILIVLIGLIVSITGNVLVDPMYGGTTFALSYAYLSNSE